MSLEFNPIEEKNRLEDITAQLLEKAKRAGANGCEVVTSASVGLDAQARMGEPEKLEMTRDQSVSVTVFVNDSRGTSTTTDFSPDALNKAVEAALAIAKVTAPDPASMLAPADQIINEVPDLDLDHPWNIGTQDALALAIEVETAGRESDHRITNSEGSSVSTSRSLSVHGTTEGLMVSQTSSMHGISCVLLAESGGSRERSYAYTQARDASQLTSAEVLGRQAAERTIARLNPRKCDTGEVPVLFAMDVAAGLLSNFFSAISGGSLYRKSSYLLDRLGTQVMPNWANLVELPRLNGAIGSSAYDTDGLPTREQGFVKDGILISYLLSLYSANRLGLYTTHNAGGARNVFFQGEQSYEDLVKKIDKGLIITELMGQGVNLVNGDYSRGASGFWVEEGEIIYPVHEVTVASNLSRMLNEDLVAVGCDIDLRRSITSGSLLVEQMMVAGR